MGHNSHYRSIGRSALPLVVLLLFIAGCSDGRELTRSAAKDMILANSGFPTEHVESLLIGRTGLSTSKSKEAYAESLEKAGLATVVFESKEVTEKVAFSTIRSTKVSMLVTLTDEGQKYARGEPLTRGYETNISVVARVESFGEVTGIAFQDEQQSRAVVEYTTHVEPTPFGPIFRRGSASRTVARSAVFQLYDDGWRIRRL